MKILVTGNLGYLGSVLMPHLKRVMPLVQLFGFDAGYFASCLTAAPTVPERHLECQYFGDVRSFPEPLLERIDAVVHLAAISNDPMGDRFSRATRAINFEASVELLRKSVAAGVRNFVFASSCSIYGCAEKEACKESDPLQPLTSYARSKVDAEQAFTELDLGATVVTSLRFATACGMSPRLRLDLVLNDFVASAMTAGRIEVLSDGSPWRPLIAVEDIARAIEWAIRREAANGGQFLAVNVGSDAWNFRVRELAAAVATVIPETEVAIRATSGPDRRSYRVDFSLFQKLAPQHQPQQTLPAVIDRLRAGLATAGFRDPAFRSSNLVRLRVLEHLVEQGHLCDDLTWATPGPTFRPA